ncbi:hypothetical protein GW17_00019621 [Ensete ventricosum]|nr:hypothetical protein GW17_00019621 [Ensete ventricosum]
MHSVRHNLLHHLWGHSFTANLACLQIGTFISAHGWWIYAKHATENDEADTFFKRDFGEELPATSTVSNQNRKSSKFRNVCEWVDNEQKAGFWGYLMQIAYQLMGCMHTLNLVFLLLDTALNSLVDYLLLSASVLLRKY